MSFGQESPAPEDDSCQVWLKSNFLEWAKCFHGNAWNFFFVQNWCVLVEQWLNISLNIRMGHHILDGLGMTAMAFFIIFAGTVLHQKWRKNGLITVSHRKFDILKYICVFPNNGVNCPLNFNFTCNGQVEIKTYVALCPCQVSWHAEVKFCEWRWMLQHMKKERFHVIHGVLQHGGFYM